MKLNYITLSFLILLSFPVYVVNKHFLDKKNLKNMTPNDFYLTSKFFLFYLSATLFQNSNLDVKTQLKPDNDSSALKLSREELGRYTWYQTKFFTINFFMK